MKSLEGKILSSSSQNNIIYNTKMLGTKVRILIEN